MTSSSRKSRRKWLILILLLVLLGTVGQNALNNALGRVVADVFSEGTGCIVTLTDPKISYFPLRGEIRNVHVYHPEEGVERGFRAEALKIQLDFLRLLRKKVLISHLEITGSDVTAVQENTSLYKILEFIFKKHPPAPAGTPKPWHSFVSSGWKVWAPLVEITTNPTGQNLLEIGLPSLQLQFDQASFVVKDPVDSPDSPAIFYASGTHTRLNVPGAPPLALGEFKTAGTIGRGIWTFKSAELIDSAASNSERVSKILATGPMSTPGEGSYGLDIQIELYDQFFSNLVFPATEYLSQLGPKLVSSMRLRGTLLRPTIDGNLQFQMSRGAPLMVRDECAFKNVSAGFSFNTQQLVVSGIQAEDLIKGASFALQFNETLSFTAALGFTLNEQSTYLAQCLGPAGSITDEKLQPIALALHQALADSHTELEASGELKTRLIRGKLLSDIYVNDLSSRSRLQADIGLNGNVIEAELSERGVVPQISSKPPSAASETQTKFSTVFNSNFASKVRYDLQAKELDVKQLTLTRYPADRLLARLAPFLPAETFQTLLTVVKRESLVDAKGELAVSFADLRGKGAGSVSITQLSAGPLPIDRITIPWSADGTGLRLPNASLETPAGAVIGTASIDQNRNLQFTASGSGLLLHKLPAIADRTETLQATADLKIQASGPVTSPKYQMDAQVRTRIENGLLRTSSATVTGDLNQVSAKGSALDGRASFEISRPLKKDSAELLTAKVDIDRFPLEEILGSDPDAKPGTNSVTAHLVYSGPAGKPLAGSGKLVVDELRFAQNGVSIGSREPLSASIANGRLDFTNVRLYLDDKRLEIRGAVDQNIGWQTSIVGDWELSQLFLPTDALEQLSGGLGLDLQISGPFAQPRIDGTVALRDASVSFPLGKTIVGADQGSAKLLIHGNQIDITDISARVGDGKLSGAGSISDAFDADKRHTQILAAVDRTRIEPIDNLTMSFTGGLSLEQVGQTPLKIGGKITILDALYEAKIDLIKVIRQLAQYVTGVDTRAAVSPRRIETNKRENIELDLQIQAANDMLIETDIAQAELQGLLTISGSPAKPAVDGKIRSIDGVFRLGASEFDIILAELTFDSKYQTLDPRVDILAETRVDTAAGETQQIGLSVGGSIAAPKVKFTSDSGLAESEIVALFGFGGGGFSLLTKGKEEYTFRELLDPRSRVGLRDRLVNIAGFTEVQVDTALSEDTGEFVPRVRAKRPLIDEVRFTVQSELAGQQLSTLGLDYPLAPYLTLVGGWKSRSATADADTTTGTYSAGVEYKRSYPGLNLLPSFEPAQRSVLR